MLAALRMARVVAVLAAAIVGMLVVATTAGWAAKGGVTIFDDPGCVGTGNSAKVEVPFSIGITGLTPLTTRAVGFITDINAQPNITYGPIPIRNVDDQGNACIDVVAAQPGHWKVDIVEEGSGFTDSKVVEIVGSSSPTTTTTAPRPPLTTTTTTSTTPSTIGPGTSTTTSTTTTATTTAPPRTTTTTVGTISRPGSDLPWTIESVDPSALDTTTTAPIVTSVLPRTGSAQTTPVVAVAVVFVLAGAAFVARTRRR